MSAGLLAMLSVLLYAGTEIFKLICVMMINQVTFKQMIKSSHFLMQLFVMVRLQNVPMPDFASFLELPSE